jgi:foldase protein PrsA
MAKLAVAVTIAAPGFSRAIGDDQIAHWRQAQGGDARALSFLIDAAWSEGEAQERGIGVTGEDAAQAVDKQPHDGLTKNDLIYEARIALLAARIRDQIAQPAAQSVTQPQIDAYVQAHPLLGDEQRRVRLLVARNRSQAKAAAKALRRGLTWERTADRYTRNGGAGLLTYETPDDRLERAIFRARRNRLTRYGRYVFKVTKITPAGPLPLDQQRATAWEVLSSEAQQRAIDAFKLEFRAKWRPRTICEPPRVTHPDCGNSPTVQ